MSSFRRLYVEGRRQSNVFNLKKKSRKNRNNDNCVNCVNPFPTICLVYYKSSNTICKPQPLWLWLWLAAWVLTESFQTKAIECRRRKCKIRSRYVVWMNRAKICCDETCGDSKRDAGETSAPLFSTSDKARTLEMSRSWYRSAEEA